MYRLLGVVTLSLAVDFLEAQPQDELGAARKASAMFPTFSFPSQIFAPSWERLQQPFDMLAFQPDVLWNNLLSSFDAMISNSMLSMPKIDVSEDCMVTVKLPLGTNLNDTDIKVYTSERDIELHITTVRVHEWRSDGEPQETEAELNTTERNGRSKLRGFGEMASSTTIRKIPAPKKCEVFSELAKATLDTKTNSLLIKFPKKPDAAESVETASAPAADAALSDETKDIGRIVQQAASAVNLAPLMDKSPEKKGWWSSMFDGGDKKTIPIVNREEF